MRSDKYLPLEVLKLNHYYVQEMENYRRNSQKWNYSIAHKCMCDSVRIKFLKDYLPKESIQILENISALAYNLEEWRRNKQVYTFTKDFYDMLCTMEDVQVESRIFLYLPYRSFFIELQEHHKYGGIFVKFEEECNKMFFFLVSKERTCTSLIIDLNENITIKELARLMAIKNTKWAKQVGDKIGMTLDVGFSENEIMEILIFGLEATMYLCAKNCQIKENETQKNIYKAPKSDRIKDKYSEVRKWDVGYRLSAEEKKTVEGFKNGSNKKCAERNRPRQHWRRAHWHTYWTGKGRTTKELKFIPPVLVNNINDTMPIVDHKVN